MNAGQNIDGRSTEPAVDPRQANFAEYFRYEYPRIRRELEFVLGDSQAAHDIAHDAFVRQYVHWSRISSYDKPGAWVRRVAIRLAMRHQRRSRLIPWGNSADDEITAPPPTELILDVRKAVLMLPRAQRVAVVLHYYRDFPVVLVADAMGCKVATAKTHLQRARARLAELLGEYRTT